MRAHQFTEHGTFPGVGVAVDLDIWLGDAKSLRAWIRGEAGSPGGGGKPSPEPTMTTKQVQQLLKTIGWPIKADGKRGPTTANAIKDFQRGFVGDPEQPALLGDGLVGPKTEAAIRWSAANDGRCSAHFQFKEFASSKSGWIRTHRDLVIGLEKLREHLGQPVGVLSGFRDFDLGASMSQHKFGNAIDPSATLPHFTEVAKLGVFSGIGYFQQTGLVRHVDVRHVGPNSTGGTRQKPTIFIDASERLD